MSFDTLKVKDLKSLAADFAVDANGLKNKAEIIAALSEEGVTWSVYQKTIKDIEDATDEFSENAEEIIPRFDPNAQPEDTVLVRMTRDNFRYDIDGFTFTKVVCEPTHKLASDPLTEKVVDMVGETEILEFPATAFHE